jgi:phosphatidylglycerol:prolipoprotein diacylglycerol transferase
VYPRLTDIFSDLFGFSFPLPLYSFGAMVATAILLAAWLIRKELDRFHAEGRLKSVMVTLPADKAQNRPKAVRQKASPGHLIGVMALLAGGLGVAGSKLFHILENLDQFFLDPAGMIFSAGGLTFYGGLITAAAGIAYYVHKKGLDVPTVADAFAPSLILGYGIGRLGCYLAGDGDWGVCSSLADKPAWIPSFLWSETFPRNILGIDLQTACGPGFDGVFPTMLYELVVCAALAGVLWGLRRHGFLSGWLFGLYLIFTGAERFLIEQIRVNNTFSLLGIELTQAEVISILLITAGVVIVALRSRRREMP